MIKPYILCAAIWCKDNVKYHSQPINVKTGFVVCGRRHHNCFNTLDILNYIFTKENIIQGFITSNNKFVTRRKAVSIAIAANQTNNEQVEFNLLISEDLY